MRKTLNPEKVEKNALASIQNFHADAVAEVETAIQNNEWVIVGMKQNPVVKSARKYLDSKNIKYKYIKNGSYFSEWKKRLAIKLWSGWPTFPQVFHKGTLVGGFSDLKKYDFK
jgi:glutaredoxin-related protein